MSSESEALVPKGIGGKGSGSLSKELIFSCFSHFFYYETNTFLLNYRPSSPGPALDLDFSV